VSDTDETARPNVRVGDALAAVLSSEGEMVTKWVTVCEVIDTDGTRALRVMADQNATDWDVYGLLNYAAAMQGDDDDE
jgi:hypothetical protein